jgi:hypothetical protein
MLNAWKIPVSLRDVLSWNTGKGPLGAIAGRKCCDRGSERPEDGEDDRYRCGVGTLKDASGGPVLGTASGLEL